MAVSAKEKHTVTLLNYLANPDNDFLTRKALAIDVLGYKSEIGMYKLFTTDELDDIEREGLRLRRTRYQPYLAKIDKAVIREAESGNAASQKLAYQRFEDWSERQRKEVTGRDGAPVEIKGMRGLLDAIKSQQGK